MLIHDTRSSLSDFTCGIVIPLEGKLLKDLPSKETKYTNCCHFSFKAGLGMHSVNSYTNLFFQLVDLYGPFLYFIHLPSFDKRPSSYRSHPGLKDARTPRESAKNISFLHLSHVLMITGRRRHCCIHDASKRLFRANFQHRRSISSTS